MTRRLAPLLFIALLVSPGCKRSKMPALNAVKGQVTRSGTPVPRVIVTLRSEEIDQSFTVKGTSDSSGDLEVVTIEARTNLVKSGAPAGDYTVTVMVPMDEKQQGGATLKLPQKFKVGTGDNILNIDLDRLKKQ